MNALPQLARSLLALAAGGLLWSSRVLAPRPERAGGEPTPRAKLELSARLSRAAADPASVSKSDLKAVRSAWGADSARLLELLRDASQQ